MNAQSNQGRLTTHVLDTALGQPAAGLKIELFRLEDKTRSYLKTAITNDDGRTDGPMLEGADLEEGSYELIFSAGDYIRRTTGEAGNILFLDEVPIRFGIGNASQHYHVPLLLSPFGYSTYRGS